MIGVSNIPCPTCRRNLENIAVPIFYEVGRYVKGILKQPNRGEKMTQNEIISAVENLWGKGMEIRQESAKYLAALDSNFVFPVLRQLLLSNSPETRAHAAEAMLILDDSTIGEILFLLDSAETWLRCHMCGLLLDYGYAQKDVLEKLICLISTDPEPDVRGMACETLGWIGNESCIESLTDVACNDNIENTHATPVRIIAVRALATLAKRLAGKN
jgi:HEAT repeat protein